MKRILTTNTIDKIGEEVKLSGWIHTRRDHGKLIFVDLRDRKGLVQLVFLPENKEVHEKAQLLRSEWVVEVIGKVNERPGSMKNEKVPTGNIEIEVKDLTILNKAKTPPFEIDSDEEANEEIRLNYRYLDLRRLKMRKNLVTRHKVIKSIRDFMDKYGFYYFELHIFCYPAPVSSYRLKSFYMHLAFLVKKNIPFFCSAWTAFFRNK